VEVLEYDGLAIRARGQVGGHSAQFAQVVALACNPGALQTMLQAQHAGPAYAQDLHGFEWGSRLIIQQLDDGSAWMQVGGSHGL
jgi:hypothetical protein